MLSGVEICVVQYIHIIPIVRLAPDPAPKRQDDVINFKFEGASLAISDLIATSVQGQFSTLCHIDPVTSVRSGYRLALSPETLRALAE